MKTRNKTKENVMNGRKKSQGPKEDGGGRPGGEWKLPPTKVGKPVGAGEEGSRRVSPSPVCLEQP